MMTIEVDSLGRMKKQVFSGKGKFKYTYEFLYNHQSKLAEIQSFTNKLNRFTPQTKIKFDKNGMPKVSKSFINGKLIRKTTYKHNFKKQLRETVTKRYRSIDNYEKISFLYNDAGQLIKRLSTEPGLEWLEYEYDKNGNEIMVTKIDRQQTNSRIIYILKDYDDENKVIKEKIYCQKRIRLPDLPISIYANPGDIVVNKFEYDKKGLLTTKRTWLNNLLMGVAKYAYSFY